MKKKQIDFIEKERHNPLLGVILILLLICILIHLLGPILGISLGFAAIAMQGLIAFLALCTIGVFLLPFIGVLLVGIWVFVSGIIGIFLFPVLLPAIILTFMILALTRLFSR